VCKDLRYLDDRPVFDEDRRAADAFNRGGLEEERAERRRIREETNAKHDRNMKAFQEMVDNARREKAAREAMQAEDKFTKETDPVETEQQRIERTQQKWKEEHADEIKDDMKEYAERCLANERAGKGGDTATPAAPAESAEPAAAEEEATDTAAADEESTTNSGKEVDNRKLVYEDIWDDVPPLAPRGAAEATAASDRAGGSAEDKAAPEVFMPWATGSAGATGLDDLPVPSAAVERRMAELQRQRQENKKTPAAKAEEAEAAAGGTTWYSKYAEKVQQVEAQVEKAKLGFAPPPRKPASAGITEVAPGATPASQVPPAVVAANAAVATTSAAAQAEGEDGGELDEMD